MKQAELFGYKVLENGVIIGFNNEPISFAKTITIMINGEMKSVSYARFVYYAFHQNDFDFSNHSYCVKHIDNNPKNNAIDNLYITNEKDYLWGEKHKKSKLTNEEVEEIRRLYYIGEEDNKGNGLNNPTRKYSYRKLAEKFGVSHSLIKAIVKGECRVNE